MIPLSPRIEAHLSRDSSAAFCTINQIEARIHLNPLMPYVQTAKMLKGSQEADRLMRLYRDYYPVKPQPSEVARVLQTAAEGLFFAIKTVIPCLQTVKEVQQTSLLLNFPSDLIGTIFSHLAVSDLERLSATCRQAKRLFAAIVVRDLSNTNSVLSRLLVVSNSRLLSQFLDNLPNDRYSLPIELRPTSQQRQGNFPRDINQRLRKIREKFPFLQSVQFVCNLDRVHGGYDIDARKLFEAIGHVKCFGVVESHIYALDISSFVTSIEKLVLPEITVATLQTVANSCQKLTHLSLHSAPRGDLSPLSPLSHVTHLEFRSSQVASSGLIAKCPNLKSLRSYTNHLIVSNNSPLQNLEELALPETFDVTQLAQTIAAFPKLNSLSLTQSSIPNGVAVQIPRTITKLELIQCARFSLRELSEQLPDLTYLDLSHSAVKIEDFAGIVFLNVEELHVRGTTITLQHRQALQNSFPKLKAWDLPYVQHVPYLAMKLLGKDLHSLFKEQISKRLKVQV